MDRIFDRRTRTLISLTPPYVSRHAVSASENGRAEQSGTDLEVAAESARFGDASNQRFLTPSTGTITPPIPPGACAFFRARLIAWVCWPATAVQTSNGLVTAQGFFPHRLFSQSELPSLPEFPIQFC